MRFKSIRRADPDGPRHPQAGMSDIGLDGENRALDDFSPTQQMLALRRQ